MMFFCQMFYICFMFYLFFYCFLFKKYLMVFTKMKKELSYYSLHNKFEVLYDCKRSAYNRC